MLSIKVNDKYEETIKYSKFIALSFRVYSAVEVDNYLEMIKEEYPNANHYCYGYVIGSDIKSSDDGEPNKTAGIPILNQITGNNLNNVLVVVVRYYGGIKLGAGNLARTYAKMAKMVVKKENIITLVMGYDIDITFNYSDSKEVDYLIANAKILDKKYEDKVFYHLLVSEEVLNSLKKYEYKINKKEYIEKE